MCPETLPIQQFTCRDCGDRELVADLESKLGIAGELLNASNMSQYSGPPLEETSKFSFRLTVGSTNAHCL